jgi:AcrR family transcriptional regulator
MRRQMVSRRTARPRQVPPLGRDEWIAAALEALADQGIRGVAVEPLARRLGVTKGSFYWHFNDRGSLLRAALEAWEAASARLIDEMRAFDDPRAELTIFFQRALHPDAGREGRMRLEVAIAAAAPHDATVGRALSRVTSQRLEGFVSIYQRLGLSRDDATGWGTLATSVSLGLFQLVRVIPAPFRRDSARRDHLAFLVARLIPATNPPPSIRRRT